MVSILQSPTFKRAVKRLHKQHKKELDDAIRAIIQKPLVGEAKVGNLTGVRIYKFKMNKQLTLLAYEQLETKNVIKLLTLGTHENFYRNLKR